MNVEQLMQRTVHTCHLHHTLNDAARLMWEHDCGCIPIVDAHGKAIGILTDRDICMAAYTQGRPLWEVHVAEAMAPNPLTCKTSDSLQAASRSCGTSSFGACRSSTGRIASSASCP